MHRDTLHLHKCTTKTFMYALSQCHVIHVPVSQDLYKRFRRLCHVAGNTVSEEARELITSYVNAVEEDDPWLKNRTIRDE